MRLGLFILALAAGGAVAACGSDTPTVTTAPASTVTIDGFAFGPANLHVTRGTTVTWTNTDPTTHTTTADRTDAQTWDSGNLTPHTFYAVVFARDGTYTYHCAIHNYMTGTITVTG